MNNDEKVHLNLLLSTPLVMLNFGEEYTTKLVYLLVLPSTDKIFMFHTYIPIRHTVKVFINKSSRVLLTTFRA